MFCKVLSNYKFTKTEYITKQHFQAHILDQLCQKIHTEAHRISEKKLFALPPAHFQMRRRNGKGDGKGE